VGDQEIPAQVSQGNLEEAKWIAAENGWLSTGFLADRDV
jgi:hypothetical protein